MFFVGNMNSIPLPDKSVDLSFHVFSPFNELEEARILKKDGYLVLVNPGRDHLYELKKAIYDDAYYNTESEKELDNFKLIEQINVKYNIDVVNKDILNLVKMTPYFYKTKDSDIERLNNINSLNIKNSKIVTPKVSIGIKINNTKIDMDKRLLNLLYKNLKIQ